MANLSIFQGLLQPPKSVADYDLQAANVEGARLQNTTRQMQNQTAQAGLDRQNQLLALSKGLPAGASDLDRLAALRNGGFYDQADALSKTLDDRMKTQAVAAKDTADAAGTNQKTALAKRTARLQAISQFTSPEDAKQHLADGVVAGDIPMADAQMMMSKVPADPAAFKDWQLRTIQSLLTPEQQSKLTTPDANSVLTNQTSTSNNAATNARVQEEGAANRSVQMRGQNLTDARARQGLSVAMSKPFEVTGEDGRPVLVQQAKDGTIRPVTGYSPKTAADKPLNEGQAKALGFGTRMQEADKILADLAKSGTSASVPGMNAGYGVGSVVTALASDKQQQLAQAKRDFLNAVLRRESGAAIGQSEFDSGDKQYFPQVGDSPAVIAQKDRNRKLAIKGVLVEVPEKQRASITPRAASAAGASAVDADPLGLRN
jgi:hypothetical protein